jgi:iron complex outermembrane recepter protein
VMNLTDERYAESSSYNTSVGRQFAPGMPRTYYAGVRYYWN